MSATIPGAGSIRRMPALDGLRAVAILLVLMGHMAGTLPSWSNHKPWLWRVTGGGQLGITILFVLSGYLITLILLREREHTGAIGLRNYFIRRFFRIVPPFYAYLAVIIALRSAGVLTFTAQDLFHSAFFLRDYLGGHDWWTGHSWSLSIEEQFYIVWPALLVWAGLARARKYALIVVAAGPIVHFASHAVLSVLHRTGAHELTMFHYRADALMLGCLLALCEGSAVWNGMRRWSALSSWAGIAYLVAAAPYLSERFGGWYAFTFAPSLENLAVGAILVFCVTHPRALASRFLGNRVMAHLALISYSLYLWQQIFLTPLNTTWSGSFPLNLVCTFIVAEVSWRLVEDPALRIRKNFERRRETPLQAATAALP